MTVIKAKQAAKTIKIPLHHPIVSNYTNDYLGYSLDRYKVAFVFAFYSISFLSFLNDVNLIKSVE